MNMIAELPSLIDDSSLPTGAHAACIEAFFSNARALIEFLTIDNNNTYIRRRDYHPSWSPNESVRLTYLRQIYGLSSEQVSHLMKKRVTGATVPEVRISASGLTAIADNVFAEFDDFTRAVNEVDAEAGLLFEGFLKGARQRQARSSTSGGAP